MASQTPDGTPSPAPGRNPYELRLDLLHLAQSILETNAHMARDDKAEDRQTYYTTEQVIATAKELNAFVSRTAS